MTVVSAKRGRPRHPDVLTPAEWAVVDAVRHGMSGPEIARRRGVSTDAVKFHVANALVKLGLDSRASLRTWRGVPADSAIRKENGMPDDDGLRLGPIGQVGRQASCCYQHELPRRSSRLHNVEDQASWGSPVVPR